MAEETPPYVREVLTSQANLYAFLGSLAAAALLSIPFGFGIGAVPVSYTHLTLPTSDLG